MVDVVDDVVSAVLGASFCRDVAALVVLSSWSSVTPQLPISLVHSVTVSVVVIMSVAATLFCRETHTSDVP